MKYAYGEFDGQEFPTPDSLFANQQIMEFILAYGEKALDALEQLGEEEMEILEKMLAEGMLEKVAGRFRLTPKAIREMERKALMEIFNHLPRGSREGHSTMSAGAGDMRLENTKHYQYGDPISELDLNQTLRNALGRQREHGKSGVPIELSEKDLELHLVEGTTSCALAILIDMSGSMMRYGRFLAAKKVAMAMTALVRARFPQDTVDLIGFYSTARRIREDELPLLMPKPVTTHEYEVDVTVPLDMAAKTHEHFTNLQMGMHLARKVLAARGADQKLMLIITDGQPTAYVEDDLLHLQYPPTRETTMATLREALLCQRAQIRVASFALIEDYYGMEWVDFIDQMTRLCKGIAFYCASDDLASCVMESYLSGKKKKAYIA